jgi:hypothetical protein
VVTASQSTKILGKVLELDKAPAGIGSVAGQRPGDQIHAVIFREAGSIDDTCTDDLDVVSLKVIYTTD